jgi:broad specificity phosphatase PhoE
MRMKVAPPPLSPEPPFSVRIPFLLLESGVTRLTLVRHAQQDFPTNVEFDHSAWADPLLSELGRTQAAALAGLLSEQEVDVVVCSSMRRAMETAEIIASPHGLARIVRPEFVEIQSYRDVAPGVNPQTLVDPDEWAAREQAFYRQVMWDHMFFGEGSTEFRTRIRGAIETLVTDFEGQHVVLVSHGGVINAVISEILKIEDDMFFLPSHCSISRVWIKGDIRRVHSINESQHLHDGIRTN